MSLKMQANFICIRICIRGGPSPAISDECNTIETCENQNLFTSISNSIIKLWLEFCMVYTYGAWHCKLYISREGALCETCIAFSIGVPFSDGEDRKNLFSTYCGTFGC